MAFKRSGGNPDDNSEGVLSPNWTDSFFTQQESGGYGASELIKAGKTDRPDDQLLRTDFDTQKQAQAMASLLARARRFKVEPANEFCTFYMEARTSVGGKSRQQFLQAVTMTYDYQLANQKQSQPKNDNTRPIQAGD